MTETSTNATNLNTTYYRVNYHPTCPIVHCCDCKHWSNPPPSAQYGECYAQGDDRAVVAELEVKGGYRPATLWTRPGFGCTEGEARG